VEQFGDSFAPDRGDNAELGKVSPDRIDHRGLLANKQMPCAVKHQAALLRRRLGGHKPHVGSGDSLTDGLCVSHVILLTLDVGLHVSWRHQPHRMAECLELARPVVRRGASLDPNQTCWQFLEERQDGATLQLAADEHLAGGINAVDLED
jgi:hypothetical protein